MSDPVVFQQAIDLLNTPHVKAKLEGLDKDAAFVAGYLLAQVCAKCGDLLQPPAEEQEIKVTMLGKKKRRIRDV